MRGCTKPKKNHSFIGLPSVTITAAVAVDRIILWHVNPGSWNGDAAAKMYSGPLLQSLKKTWGNKRSFTIVEDGDKKGNQSGKGIRAKELSKIKARTLPPRTPSWMPLDYAIWTAIEKKMQATAPAGREARDVFLARLRRCALNLSRPWVRKQVAKMKSNIE